jgi:hypothetical protein
MRKAAMVLACTLLAGCISKQNQELDGKPVCTLDGNAFVVVPSVIDAVFLRRAEFADQLCSPLKSKGGDEGANDAPGDLQ